MVQLLTVFWCCFCISALLALFLCSVFLAAKDGFERLRRLHQVPCSQCAFFTGDYNLKCTVRPCAALTEDAIDCLDFEPRRHPAVQPACKPTLTHKKNVT